MRQAAVGVPAATVWSRPEAPSAADAPAVAPAPDVPGWAASLSHEQKLSLVGRVVTQALWGDPALVLAERGGWAQVVLPGQPSSLDLRGYPGWVPAAQLAPCGPGNPAERYVVTERAVRADVAGAGPAWVSFGTAVHVPAPAGEIPAGDDHVWAATGSGHRLRLPARALAPLPGSGAPGAEIAGNPDPGAPGPGGPAGTAQRGPTGDGPARGEAVVACALGFAGLAYLWGGVSGFGFDCSGLAWAVHRRFGITLPRDAGDQAESGQPASVRAPEPGDLVFFAERPSGRVHHVGLALGDGRMVHSPRTGRSVEVTPLAAEPYASELATARRYHACP